MGLWTTTREFIREIAVIHEVDTEAAAEKIKGNIPFRGANVWILAFSIVIASVGLNVNSTAVIIGAMLISPLMGPITGIGLAVGTNDGPLLKNATKNLVIMMSISLVASCLFFIISPLQLVNPTELEARTSPTIYDVLIALFGGLAGILESCRKEKGTVLSGVAIATALMPPLCTAGYGLANGSLHFFLGASFLFLINCVFIILATYVMVKYFHFKQAEYASVEVQQKTRKIISVVIVLVVIPSIFSAVNVIGDNNFEKNVQQFISANKITGDAYMYDYKIHTGKDRYADIYFAGSTLDEEEMEKLFESAESFRIDRKRLNVVEQSYDGDDKLLETIFDKTDAEIHILDNRIKELESQLERRSLRDIPYVQITREIRTSYADVKNVTIARGASVDDSLKTKDCITILVSTEKAISKDNMARLQEWARIRLEDDSVIVNNIITKTETNH